MHAFAAVQLSAMQQPCGARYNGYNMRNKVEACATACAVCIGDDASIIVCVLLSED